MRQIKIGKKSFTIKLSYNAQKAWQQETDKTLSDIGEDISFDDLIALIWFSLKSGAIIDGKPLELEREHLAEMLDESDVAKITTELFADIAKGVQEVNETIKKNNLVKSK